MYALSINLKIKNGKNINYINIYDNIKTLVRFIKHSIGEVKFIILRQNYFYRGFIMRNRIIIVGAGSTGSSIAYYLSKMRGNGDNIVLIDGKGIGSGMTSFSSGIIRTHYSHELVARMALYSLRFFERFDNIGYSGFYKNRNDRSCF
ncbi:MAG: FAD-dependent oxidoreductase [Candidatus Parvarchaeota archaeon]